MSAKRITLFTFLLVLTAVTACRFNAQYVNRQEDREEAEEVAGLFFNSIKEGNYEQASKLFSKEFYKVTPREKLDTIFQASETKLGKLKSLKLDKWETRTVKGSNPSGEYHLLYQTLHENYPAQQIFGMVREKEGIKIHSYRIESEAFLK